MPVINAASAAAFAAPWYQATHQPVMRKLHRIEATGGTQAAIDAILNYPFERLIYAEGDSWFDKFTPLLETGTNLLDAISTPYFTGVVDVSHIGDVVSDMVRGGQRRQTEAMFQLFDFDAILFSGGGNDLKNLFAELYDAQHGHALSGQTMAPAHFVQLLSGQMASPQADEFFDEVIAQIKAFVTLRDRAGSAKTRKAPILVNGYDYIQPRPVTGALVGGLLKVAGPWLYPSMKRAGLSDGQMFSAARAVVDKLNERLHAEVAVLPNVHVIDARGLLDPALPGSNTASGDWLDEIHPNKTGFSKLARHRWDAALAQMLGWRPNMADLIPPLDFDR